MRQEPVKAYGNLYPAGKDALEAVKSTLASWCLEAELELSGELLRLSFEGVCFPADEVAEALRPFLGPSSTGKLDLLDLEAWTLTRHEFLGTAIRRGQRDLDQVLEYSGH